MMEEEQGRDVLEQDIELEGNQPESTDVDVALEVEIPPPNPISMEDLLAQEELSLNLPRQGETRTGTIVSINKDEILVGIGAKSEGVIPSKELSQIDPGFREELEPGSEIPVYVISPEDQHGNLVLSYLRALDEADWRQALELLESRELYEGTISSYNKGGLIVNMGRLRGFIPASQVSLSRRMSYGGSTPDQRWGKMVGDPIITRVIEVDRERRRLIFSELAALQEAREIFTERLLAQIEEGEILSGRVTSLANFGAFVNINGADGLVHLTEIAWDRIQHPSQVLQAGQEVKVKVINIDHEKKRIGLSLRQLLTDPWPDKAARFKKGQLVEGRIVRLTKFGAFARLEDSDLEGLIHISELSEHRIEHPKEIVKDGEVLTLRIIKMDPKMRRIGLSLRKVHSQAYADLDIQMALAEEVEPIEETLPEEGSAAQELSSEVTVEEEPLSIPAEEASQ